MNPRPGAGFDPYEHPIYVMPDIIVACNFGHFEIITNGPLFPILHFNAYYTHLLQESQEPEVVEYLRNKLASAKWTIQAVEHRKHTLMTCAEYIIKMQIDFFRYGPGHLKPMSLADAAKAIGVHESTVSRTVNGKYLQCSAGTYPFSHFFSRGLGASGRQKAVSPDMVKALLKRFIAQENKQKPLSDQKLCERMAQQGCFLSRRTVAKYRDELGIPNTSGRKEFE